MLMGGNLIGVLYTIWVILIILDKKHVPTLFAYTISFMVIAFLYHVFIGTNIRYFKLLDMLKKPFLEITVISDVAVVDQIMRDSHKEKYLPFGLYEDNRYYLLEVVPTSWKENSQSIKDIKK